MQGELIEFSLGLNAKFVYGVILKGRFDVGSMTRSTLGWNLEYPEFCNAKLSE